MDFQVLMHLFRNQRVEQHLPDGLGEGVLAPGRVHAYLPLPTFHAALEILHRAPGRIQDLFEKD